MALIDHNKHNPQTPWYRQFWPWFIITLPASVVAAGIYTVVLSFRYQDSLVNGNYYKDGMAINRLIEQRITAEKLNMRAAISFDLREKNITAIINNSNKINLVNITLTLSHPTNSTQDISIALKQNGEDIFIGNSSSQFQGRWYLKLDGSTKEKEQSRWRLTGEIDLSTTHNVLLQP